MQALILLLAALPLNPVHQHELPWMTLEAEDMRTTGTVAADASDGHPAKEASGRKCVHLTRKAGALSFTMPKLSGDGLPVGMVIRYSLPDPADGSILRGDLPVLVNGKAKAVVPLTTEFSHQYGSYPFTKKSSDGSHRHFWDEAAITLSGVRAGDKISLNWNGPSDLFVDLVDVESVPKPIPRPVNSISLADFGVGPNRSGDVSATLSQAISSASSSHRTLFIPEGAYHVGGEFALDHVKICGAGMWQTTFLPTLGPSPKRITLLGAGDQICIQDLSLRSSVTYRNDAEPNDGVSGSFGHGSLLKNLWIEHSKVGMWLTNSSGLKVETCRIRDTIADGINLCLGMENTVVRGCTTRGTGDDCFAMWPAAYAKSRFGHGENTFIDCTAQLPYLAQGFALYGGRDQTVVGCTAQDICYGPGFYASTTFPTVDGFHGTQTFQSNRCVRSVFPNAAFALFADHQDLPGISVKDLLVIDPTGAGIRLSSTKTQRVVDASFEKVSSSVRNIFQSPVYAVSPGCLGTARIENSRRFPSEIQKPPDNLFLVTLTDEK